MRTLALVAALVGALLLATHVTPAEEACQGTCGGQVCRVPGTGAGGNCLVQPGGCACVPEVTPTATPRPEQCTGDCDGDGRVTIDELMAGVGIALGDVGHRQCAAAFCHAECGPGPAAIHLDVSCLVGAVVYALDGCPADPCRDDADCDDGNACTADQCTSEGCVSACLCV